MPLDTKATISCSACNLSNTNKILKKNSKRLSKSFILGFQEEHLKTSNLINFYSQIKKASNIVLFCVEEEPQACHRSLVANHLITNNPNIIVLT